MDLLLHHGATSFLPQLSPDPKVAHFSQVTHIMEDLIASTKSQSATGPPPEPASSPSSPAALITRVKEFVKKYMSQPQYDASHDYNHILRVLALAEHILSIEQAANPSVFYDPTIVTLAALMHDVGDHKYQPTTILPGGSDDPITLVKTTLIDLGAPLCQARYVQTIVKSVSYSHEIRDPAHVRGVLLQHPELAIVQDADRLDALGAVGIGRTFTYTGAKGQRTDDGMQETIRHFEQKLERLVGMMKTGEGKRLAKERTQRLKVFQEWWEEENGMLMNMGR
ncbi:hypothetical protein MMC18_007195 [Xylographa bjoerkii]|nr:hypothetical protein [Xylographa bjoerkii]